MLPAPPKAQEEKLEKNNKNWKGTKIFEANSLDLEADLDYITILFMTEYLNSSCAQNTCFCFHCFKLTLSIVFDTYRLKGTYIMVSQKHLQNQL